MKSQYKVKVDIKLYFILAYSVDEIEIIAIFKENSQFLEISKKITFYYTMIINCLFIFPIL